MKYFAIYTDEQGVNLVCYQNGREVINCYFDTEADADVVGELFINNGDVSQYLEAA